MPINIINIINNFIINNKEQIYNEPSIQFELGFYIREEIRKLGRKDYAVEFERNIKDIGIFDSKEIKKLPKKEMDIYIYKKNSNERYVIELKYPNDSDATTSFENELMQDIHFIQELRKKFTRCISFSIVDITPNRFYVSKRNSNSELNLYIRPKKNTQPKEITGNIEYRINNKTFSYKFSPCTVKWKTLNNNQKYSIIIV